MPSCLAGTRHGSHDLGAHACTAFCIPLAVVGLRKFQLGHIIHKHSVPCMCTLNVAGDPNQQNANCYDHYGTPPPSPDSTTTYYSGCPAGYTVAASSVTKPFDTTWARYKYETYDIRLANGGILGLPYSVTSHNGVRYTVTYYPLPSCTGDRIMRLADTAVSMSRFWDNRIMDKRNVLEEQQSAWEGTTLDGVLTKVWDLARDTLYAKEQYYHYTVFHGTHTCYDNCDQYFSSSYYNTDPNPSLPTTSQSEPSSISSDYLPSGSYGHSSGGGSVPVPTVVVAMKWRKCVGIGKELGLAGDVDSGGGLGFHGSPIT
ncbi:hypothetical protein B0T22DRAFT_442349 [Podospora appendiculata]|uniref:Uncharacterized protein n=1 Tax=Podospora appendiculata TaxID=314037 RepID=A0AAE1CA52_9PEZI|nr:hypothetical protein B0T22DRAFT_442349 [Podospora appendiculata]